MATSKTYETFYVHSWTINDFEQLYVDYSYNDDSYSGSFTSPCFTSPILIDNQTCDASLKTSPHYKWRLRIHFATGRNIYLLLRAYKSNYESDNNLGSRTAIWKFDVGRMTENNEFKILSCDERVTKKTVQYFSNMACFGEKEICEVDSIFEDGNFDKKTDLTFRVHFLVEINNELPSCERCLIPPVKHFLNNDSFCDVVFKFECGSEIKASRVILALKSSYFRRMFEGEWIESQSSTINMKDIKYECFKLLINYIYTNNLDKGLSFDILKDLYLEADLRDLKKLKELINQQIISLLNNDNLDEILLVALQTNNEDWKKFVFTYVKRNM